MRLLSTLLLSCPAKINPESGSGRWNGPPDSSNEGNDRDHYRGRQFRPDHERKEALKDERRHDKQEMKDERKRDKEEMKDDRRRDKEERKEEKQDRKHDKHDRD
jgi:hypothetical protein